MKIARLNDHHLCPECRSAVGRRVKICPVCKSYQDWRRHVSINSASLALLVALITVSTPLVNLAVYYSKPAGSEIGLLMTNATDNSFEFLAKNDGRSQGMVRITSFYLGVVRTMKKNLPMDQLANKGILLSPGTTQSIAINDPLTALDKVCSEIDVPEFSPVDEILIRIFGDDRSILISTALNLKFVCGFNYTDTSFYHSAAREISVPCPSIPPASYCLSKKLNDKYQVGRALQ
jgi:hypothetical protein